MATYDYESAASYDTGDGVLYAGCIWIAARDGVVSAPGGKREDWRLAGRVANYPGRYHPIRSMPLVKKSAALPPSIP